MKKSDIVYAIKEGIANACCIILATVIVALLVQSALWWVDPNPYNKVERIFTLVAIIGLGGPTIAALSACFKWIWNHF
ncbi:hypothetical protein [uncultured Duncaniella sp.]|uniref:hypothetical protein n=1 Tax=uncultured Duncaniella sp. TaxID=2768039 RepID=UPI0026158D71|nr:hypothetical protein [uncultured Duncaniella sp.]